MQHIQLPRLHLITDAQRHSHLALAQKAAAYPSVALQYREKNFSWETHGAELQTISELCRKKGLFFILNDHVDLLSKVSAHGIHVGQDTPLETLLHHIPPFVVVGVSVHTPQEYERVASYPITYVGVGPVFETTTKSLPYPPLGIEGLKNLIHTFRHPVIAIGGITPERAERLFEAIPQLHGVATVSAFAHAEMPEQIVEAFLKILPIP
ncbi:MAG: thiamine phosphate synthase [Bacteroidia bacterium]